MRMERKIIYIINLWPSIILLITMRRYLMGRKGKKKLQYEKRKEI
jgi:hypothetical protein